MKITVTQASKILDISRSAIHSAIKNKTLKAKKFLGRSIIEDFDLMLWHNAVIEKAKNQKGKGGRPR